MNDKSEHTINLHVSATVRWIFFILGWFFVVLAIIGIALPLLPTTPFILLAAASFARSSEKFYQFLLNNRHFGPAIRDWHRYHCMAKKYKILAICLIVPTFGTSIYMLREITIITPILVIIMMLLILMLLRIKTCLHSESINKL